MLADIVNAAAWYRTGEQEAAEMVVRVYSYANYTKVGPVMLQYLRKLISVPVD